MSVSCILFDLDGTLLPMDQDVFVKTYFKGIAAKLAPLGYEPQALIDAIWKGTAAMLKNDGAFLNEDAFWKVFAGIYGERALDDMPVFDDFYRNEFENVKSVCGFDPDANKTIKQLKSMGYRLALATNPIFPEVATRARMRWAGLDADDFELFTTYENIGYSKPNLRYYEEIAKKLDAKCDECLMVGNDVGDDIVAKKLGFSVFLMTENLINKTGEDISNYPQGGFSELIEFVKNIL